jgi:thioredoxin 1
MAPLRQSHIRAACPAGDSAPSPTSVDTNNSLEVEAELSILDPDITQTNRSYRRNGMSKKLEFNDANFQSDVIASSLPVLVDFWAPWCHPCRALDPIVEEIAGDYDGRLKVGKLNTDDNREVAMKYGILSLPTLVVFKNGEAKARIVGLQPKKAIADRIDEVL